MTKRDGRRPRFASVVLDVDSTLSGLEGIDWLAARRAPEVSVAVATLTARAMRGDIPLEAVFGERLAAVRPARADVDALARAYVAATAPGAADAIGRMRAEGVRVAVVSGGIREAVAPFAESLGVSDEDVHAVRLRYQADGSYSGYDASSLLTTALGKCAVVEALLLPAPALAVGDGATDLAMRPAVAAFAAYTGFVRRESVVAAADHVVPSFTSLLELVLR